MSLPTNVDFVLTAFEQSFTLSTSALIPSETLTLDVSATITLSNGISVADLQKVFFYRTDEDITSLPFDSSFVYYYTDVGMWPTTVSATPIRDTLNPTNGIVTGNYYVSGDNMSKDFIRELGRQLFGTHLGADLFTNEDNVVTDIQAQCATVSVAIENKIKSVDRVFGGALCTADASGSFFMKDNTSDVNLCREMILQLMAAAPTRFAAVENSKYDDRAGYYKVPFVAGDTLNFKVTLLPSAGQRAAVPTGTTAMVSRSYMVKLNVTA